jgi:hypothetical protein
MTFTAGQRVTAASLNGVTVNVVTSATHPASPVAGEMIFESDTGDTYIYNGSSFTFLNGPQQEWDINSTTGSLSSIANTTDTAYAFVATTRAVGVTIALGTTGTTIGTSGTKVTLNKSGRYTASASMRYVSASGYFYSAIRHYNSSNAEQARWGGGATTTGANPQGVSTGEFTASAGDYIQVWVFQSSGGSVALDSANGGCRFAGHYLHP